MIVPILGVSLSSVEILPQHSLGVGGTMSLKVKVKIALWLLQQSTLKMFVLSLAANNRIPSPIAC